MYNIFLIIKYPFNIIEYNSNFLLFNAIVKLVNQTVHYIAKILYFVLVLFNFETFLTIMEINPLKFKLFFVMKDGYKNETAANKRTNKSK